VEHAGLHQTYIGLLERGLRNPTLNVAEILSCALGKKLSDLISEAEDLQQPKKIGVVSGLAIKLQINRMEIFFFDQT
jgi:transcriptional regulator with XRE-family HTH domain